MSDPVRVERQYRQKRDEGGIAKTLIAFIRRADEGTLSRLMVEATILLAASRHNGTSVLKDAAALYKVDTEGIGQKVKQEFVAKAKEVNHREICQAACVILVGGSGRLQELQGVIVPLQFDKRFRQRQAKTPVCMRCGSVRPDSIAALGSLACFLKLAAV